MRGLQSGEEVVAYGRHGKHGRGMEWDVTEIGLDLKSILCFLCLP